EFLRRKISVHINNKELDEALSILKSGVNVDFRVTDNGILVKDLSGQETKDSQEKRKVSGTIKDEDGIPIAGANIFIEGTSTGAISDFDGNFSLLIPGDTKTISVTYLGYKRQDIDVTGRTEISVILQEDTSKLDEVVVVGYGTETRRNITGAISSIEPEDVVTQPKSNVIEML